MRAKVRHFRLSQLSTLNSQLASPSSRLHRISRSTGILPVGPTDILSVASVTAGYKPAGPEPNDWPMGSCIQLQQRNCSRFARDFLRRSTFSSSQRTKSRSSGLRSALQDLFNRLCPRLVLLPICSSPAELVSSAPISHAPCKKNFRAHGSQ